MRVLVVDVGNSWAKVAVYEDTERVSAVEVVRRSELAACWLRLAREFGVCCGFAASVVDGVADELERFREGGVSVRLLRSTDALPFAVDYETPSTLGVDRLAAVAGAVMLRGVCDMLIVDAGTMITYEFFSSRNVYLGGNISPGLGVRFAAVHDYTSRLPRLGVEDYECEVGRSTRSAIAAGVVDGVVMELEGYVLKAERLLPRLSAVILTGGDCEILAERLSGRAFAVPDLVLDGVAFWGKCVSEG